MLHKLVRPVASVVRPKPCLTPVNWVTITSELHTIGSKRPISIGFPSKTGIFTLQQNGRLSASSVRAVSLRHLVTQSSSSSQGEPDGYMTIKLSKDKSSIQITLPLPHVRGLKTVSLPTAGSVDALKAALVSASDKDSLVHTDDITVCDSNGDVVSQGSRLALFIDKPWSIRMKGFTVGSGTTGQGVAVLSPVLTPQGSAYGALKTALQSLKRERLAAAEVDGNHSNDGTTSTAVLPFSEFVKVAKSVAATHGISGDAEFQAHLQKWLRLLHQEGEVVHLSASEDPHIANTLFLEPQLSQAELQRLFDLQAKRVWRDIDATSSELDAVKAKLMSMDEFSLAVHEKARKSVRNLSLLVGTGMVVQWGVIFNYVYDLSWDIMEPICYFISTGYGLLFYLMFFLRTRRDPTTTSIFGHFFNNAVARAHRSLAKDETWKSVPLFAAEQKRLQEVSNNLTDKLNKLVQSLPPSQSSPTNNSENKAQ